MPKIQTKTIWPIPKPCAWLWFSYSAAMMVQRMKETTMPETEVRKSGRRPTRSTKKAALMETIKLRRALPILRPSFWLCPVIPAFV